MARNMYGATSADFTITSGGRVIPGAVLTLWTARTGGTQVTDLLDRDNVATTTVTSAADGSVVYYGPNNDKTVHWADSGQGSRIAIRPVDITGDPPVLSIGTVTTGAAAANLTGTSESPVLNLTLPTAGANGVDTAAIQDSAVTSAKIADGTITSTDVAADTFAAFGTVGNRLTANQASVETDVSPFGAFLNCTISRSTAHSVHGSACLQAVATTEGQFIAGLPTTSFPAVPGETITATFALKADRELSDVRVAVQWASGGSPGAVVYRTVTATTSWVTHSLTVVVPPGVDTAGLLSWVTSSAPAGSEIYMDCFGVWKGAGGTWALPGTPIVGQSHIAANGAYVTSGTVAPEGVITAPPLSRYQQVSGAVTVTGAMEWVKATGTGNTGWVAGAEADTGPRVVTVDGAGWSGALLLRRIGNQVQVYTNSSNFPIMPASGTQIMTLPTGFTADTGACPGVAYNMWTGATVGVLVSGTSSLSVNLEGDLLATRGLAPLLTFISPAGWPSSLPGSAA